MPLISISEKIRSVSAVIGKSSGELARGIKIEEEDGVLLLEATPGNEFGIPAGGHGPNDYVNTKWGMKSLAQLLISIARQHRLRNKELNFLKRFLSQTKHGPKLQD